MNWDRDRERRAGRALSIGGSIYGVLFLIVWCVIVAITGAWFMLIFGVPMLIFMVYRLIFCIRKASEKKREPDPWERTTRPRDTYSTASGTHSDSFCPYCGRELSDNFTFCPTCGRRL